MALTALLLSVLALLLALAARATARGQVQATEDAQAEARRRVENLREELESALGRLREMTAVLADGGVLDGEMVRDDRLWRDVLPHEGAEMLGEGVRVLDVRTERETAEGVIPGAILMPVDELEARARELPKDGKPTLVYCAGGGRSAAACEFLAREGWVGLMNLAGGISSWTGPIEHRN